MLCILCLRQIFFPWDHCACCLVFMAAQSSRHFLSCLGFHGQKNGLQLLTCFSSSWNFRDAMYRQGNEKKQLNNKTLITTIFKLIFTNNYTTVRMAEQEYKTRKVKTKKKNHSQPKSKYMSGLRPVSHSCPTKSATCLHIWQSNELMFSLVSNLLC